MLTSLSCTSWGKFWEVDKTAKAAKAACSSPSVSFAMVCVPANSTGFVMDDTNIQLTHTMASITAFAMARYEVQYGDWATVYTWAVSNGYTFANAGTQGDNGVRTNQHPVTTISWRDAIVWCNAASQKDGLTPVYYTDSAFTAPLKVSNANTEDLTPGFEDNPYMKWTANGYRLPTEGEWEYAARYIDGTAYAPGSYASGATADYNNATATGLVAWNTANTTSTQPVGTKAANPLGLFDMSGSVSEWVWDWNGAYTTASPYTDADGKGPPGGGVQRLNRGGSWSTPVSDLRSSGRHSFYQWITGNDLGFRPVRRP